MSNDRICGANHAHAKHLLTVNTRFMHLGENRELHTTIIQSALQIEGHCAKVLISRGDFQFNHIKIILYAICSISYLLGLN